MTLYSFYYKPYKWSDNFDFALSGDAWYSHVRKNIKQMDKPGGEGLRLHGATIPASQVRLQMTPVPTTVGI